MALKGLERAEDLTAYLQKQLLELGDSSSEKAKEVKQELKDAKKELKEAKKELKEAEQKYKAKASVQAGRGQARVSACAVVAVAFDLQPPAWSSCVFVRSTVFAFWGDVLLSARIPSSLSFTELACSPSGSGGSWLLQVQANLVALRVLPTLQNGVSVLGSRWGGQPVLRSSCARSPGCGWFLFEARLSGYCFREGEATLGS